MGLLACIGPDPEPAGTIWVQIPFCTGVRRVVFRPPRRGASAQNAYLSAEPANICPKKAISAEGCRATDRDHTRFRRYIQDLHPNKIEHRLFSFISLNWRGRPLRTYETIVKLISNTTNRGGLVVRARLDRRLYPIGKKISAKEFQALQIERDAFHGDWNYVIRPRAQER